MPKITELQKLFIFGAKIQIQIGTGFLHFFLLFQLVSTVEMQFGGGSIA